MARLIFLDIFLQKVWSNPNLFLIFAMLKKTIDIFIRREVVDAHEMGIFLYPEHCSYTNIIYSLRLPLPKSSITPMCCVGLLATGDGSRSFFLPIC